MLSHFTTKELLKRATLATLLMLLTADTTVLFAQFTATVTEINPNQSTLDATDPDGASGGRVNGLAIARDGITCYAATEWGGLYKSTDKGRTWFRSDSHLPVATWDVEVDPSNPNKVYATSFYDGRVNSVAGINVSNDGGISWVHPATATPPGGAYTEVARRNEPSAFGISIDPDNPQNVYIGTNTGLAISNNGGLTWRYVDPTPADIADNVWDVIVHHGGIIDLVGDDGHRRSIDGGISWTTATSNALPAGRGSIAVSPDEAYVLFAVVGTTIFESDNGGTSWPTRLTNRLPQGRVPFVATNQKSGNTFDLWFGDVTLWRATCTTPAAPAPGGTPRAAAGVIAPNTAGWNGPFTRNSGAHDDVGDIAFDPLVTTDACPILFSSDGGVYYNTLSTNPACQSPVWQQPNITPHSLWLFGMDGAAQPGVVNEDLYFGNQDNGTFAATDAGATNPTWSNKECCDGFDIAANSNRVLYTDCCYNPAPANRLFLRNPGMVGGGQLALANYPPGNLPGFKAVDVVDEFGPDDFVAVTTSGVFFTNDITVNPIVWTQLGAATTPANAVGVKVSISGGTPTFYVQAGIGDGRSQDQLWRFVGTGAGAWQQINPPGGTGGFGIFDVDPVNPNRIFASQLRPGANPRMILSNNGGTNWTVLANLDILMNGAGAFRYQNQRGPTDFTGFGGYPQPTLVALDPDDANILVAGAADAGVFVSIDGGTNWTLVTDPFNPLCVSQKPHIPRPRFAYFAHEPVSIFARTRVVNVYVGTQGRGVWRITLNIPNIVNIVNICQVRPELCGFVALERGHILIDCLGKPGCIILDEIPRNCLVKFDCPGCLTQLCPPYYYIFLDDFDLENWEVGIFTAKGGLAPHEVFDTGKGAVLSFRPSKELFIEGKIGDYLLAFKLKPNGKPDRYKIATRLEVSDSPYRSGLQVGQLK